MPNQKLDEIIQTIVLNYPSKTITSHQIESLGIEEESDDFDYIYSALEKLGFTVTICEPTDDEVDDIDLGIDNELFANIEDEELNLEFLTDDEAIDIGRVISDKIDLSKTLKISIDSASTGNEIKDFLNRIPRDLMLTSAMEMELANAISEGTKAEELLRKYKKREIDLTPAQMKDCSAKIIARSNATNRFILGNLGLIIKVAKIFHHTSKIGLFDLTSEGVFGLYKAIEKFDPSKSFKFSTYATPWIRQSISRAVAEKSRTVRIPVHVHERSIRLNKETAKLNQLNGRMPTDEELSEATGISLEKIMYTKKISREPIAFESPAGDDDSGATIADLISDTSTPSPEQELDKTTLQESIKKVFTEHLTPLQEKVITLRFGLFGINQHSLDEIASILDMPKNKIKMIEQKAVKVLRSKNIKKKLEEVSI